MRVFLLSLTPILFFVAACSDGVPSRPKDAFVPVDDIKFVFPDASGPKDTGADTRDLGQQSDSDVEGVDGDVTRPDTPDEEVTGTDLVFDEIDEETDDDKCKIPPSCDDRECGRDGCGNICGFCADGVDCNYSTGQCGACVPKCASLGRTCGDDGCGGSCGDCAPPLNCDETTFRCVGATGPCPTILRPDLAECQPADNPARITGKHIERNYAGVNVEYYDGTCKVYAPGAERAFEYTAEETGEITITTYGETIVDPLPEVLQVFILSGKPCDGMNCIATGRDVITFPVTKGTVYYFMIDSFETNIDGQFFRMDISKSWCADVVPDPE